MNAATTPVVGLEGITKAYPGVVANDEITIDLRRGEVHAIVGENGAGKSTLMGVLYGLHRADAGRIVVDGEAVEMRSPREALDHGLGFVQQHFSLIPTLTSAENLVLALRGGDVEIGLGDGSGRLRELCDSYGLTLDPDIPVEKLSVGQQQRAELLKALGRETRALAMDEPDSLLTAQEWVQLASVLRRLVDEGLGIFLVSHKLSAVLEVADRVSVLRRGRLVETIAAADADERRLAELMVGELPRNGGRGRKRSAPGKCVLSVRDLSVESDRGVTAVRGVSFELAAGEVLGVAGVEGNGQVELTEVLAGARDASGGRVELAGSEITGLGVRGRQRAGVSHVPADRRDGGVVPDLSVAENILLPELDAAPYRKRAGMLDPGLIRSRATELIERFDVRVPGPDVAASSLSGGNQQKVVLAREISREPTLLICCYPTRGLDVASAQAVRRQVEELRDRGCAVIWVSLELDELLEMSDRIAVMHDGEIAGQVPAGEADAERLGLMMTGGARA
ncbi:MAG: ABC transporter ATP-binding protein [Solirubrobacterales bacterium]